MVKIVVATYKPKEFCVNVSCVLEIQGWRPIVVLFCTATLVDLIFRVSALFSDQRTDFQVVQRVVDDSFCSKILV